MNNLTIPTKKKSPDKVDLHQKRMLKKPLHFASSIMIVICVFTLVIAGLFNSPFGSIPKAYAQSSNADLASELLTSSSNGIADEDKDGIPSSIEQTCKEGSFCDADSDGVEDYLDVDSDNDRISDKEERGPQCIRLEDCTPIDSNGDLIPDYRQAQNQNAAVRGIYEILGILFFVMICLTGYAIYKQAFDQN